MTAADLLGGVAHLALPEPSATGLAVLGVVDGVPVLGFALRWVAPAVSVRTARRGLARPAVVLDVGSVARWATVAVRTAHGLSPASASA